MDQLIAHFLFIGRGLNVTLILLCAGLGVGVGLGVVLSILRATRLGRPLVVWWVSLVRGTPLILQLSLVYFTAPCVWGYRMTVLGAGILTFGLNSSAYIAEILRSGIESLPKGQFEAARTLEIPPVAMWRDLILPQVVRGVFPGLINEVIALLKETALIGTISGMDLMRMAHILGGEEFSYFMPLCLAGAYYYGLVVLIECVGKRVEKKWAAC